MANTTRLVEVSQKVKTAISEYCRTAVNMGLCDDGDCEFCAMNDAFDRAQSNVDNANSQEEDD